VRKDEDLVRMGLGFEKLRYAEKIFARVLLKLDENEMKWSGFRFI
jgi:hypothetical protein